MRYSQLEKIEVAKLGSRRIYHLPEVDALGLANYAERDKIRYEQDVKRMNRSFRRIAGYTRKKAAHGGPIIE